MGKRLVQIWDKKLCPICLKRREHFEKHHVIWRCDGGSDDPINLLEICAICHGIITRGTEDEAVWSDRVSVAYQQMVHGLNFELKARKKGPNKSDLLNDILSSGDWCASSFRADKIIREVGFINYNVGMALIHGIIAQEELDDCKRLEDSSQDIALWEKYGEIARKLICPINWTKPLQGSTKSIAYNGKKSTGKKPVSNHYQLGFL